MDRSRSAKKTDAESRYPYIRSIVQTLKSVDKPGSFASGEEFQFPPPALMINGVKGYLGLPVLRGAPSRRMPGESYHIAMCNRAPYGRGQETIFDRSVRNTWELDPAQFTIANPKWNTRLESLTDVVKKELGCDPKLKVKCELYKFLLYERGSFFKAMGRKLRFDVRKNYERKKQSRTLKAPTRQDLQSVKCLPILLPLSAYIGAIVPNIATLHSRLAKLPDVLPPEWKCERPPDYTEHVLDIFKTGYDNGSTSPRIIFSLQVSRDFRWILLVGERLVDLSNCPPLSSLSSSLSSVDTVVNVITTLDSCHMCMGNDDTKFEDLDRSVFKDRTGMVVAEFERSGYGGNGTIC